MIRLYRDASQSTAIEFDAGGLSAPAKSERKFEERANRMDREALVA
jgi:hypothetical protein